MGTENTCEQNLIIPKDSQRIIKPMLTTDEKNTDVGDYYGTRETTEHNT